MHEHYSSFQCTSRDSSEREVTCYSLYDAASLEVKRYKNRSNRTMGKRARCKPLYLKNRCCGLMRIVIISTALSWVSPIFNNRIIDIYHIFGSGVLRRFYHCIISNGTFSRFSSSIFSNGNLNRFP